MGRHCRQHRHRRRRWQYRQQHLSRRCSLIASVLEKEMEKQMAVITVRSHHLLQNGTEADHDRRDRHQQHRRLSNAAMNPTTTSLPSSYGRMLGEVSSGGGGRGRGPVGGLRA